MLCSYDDLYVGLQIRGGQAKVVAASLLQISSLQMYDGEMGE